MGFLDFHTKQSVLTSDWQPWPRPSFVAQKNVSAAICLIKNLTHSIINHQGRKLPAVTADTMTEKYARQENSLLQPTITGKSIHKSLTVS